jgi:hypothetical protein
MANRQAWAPCKEFLLLCVKNFWNVHRSCLKTTGSQWQSLRKCWSPWLCVRKVTVWAATIVSGNSSCVQTVPAAAAASRRTDRAIRTCWVLRWSALMPMKWLEAGETFGFCVLEDGFEPELKFSSSLIEIGSCESVIMISSKHGVPFSIAGITSTVSSRFAQLTQQEPSDILLNWTNFMKQISFWEAGSSSPGQKIPHL